MKFSNTLVLGALTIAASSPTITAAPFPSDAASSTAGNGADAGVPSLSSSIGASGGPSAVTSPDPDGALSPRSRAVERFGMPPVQKRNSLRMSKEKRDGKPLERRQLLPNLGGLDLNANQLAGLQGGAGSPLSGLGLGVPALSGLGLGGLDSLTGTANGVLSQAQGLLAPVTSQAQGLLAPVTGALNSATAPLAPVGSLVNGLTGDLPLVGPLLNQVQSLTGLNNLLAGGGASNQQNALGGLGLAGVSRLASLQTLNAQLIQQELLAELSALSSGNTGPLTNNLQGLSGNLQQNLPLPNLQNPLQGSLGSLQGLAGQVQTAAANAAQGLSQPLQGVVGQAQSALAGASGLTNQAQALTDTATQALPQPLQGVAGQAQAALSGIGNLPQALQNPTAGLTALLPNGLPSVPNVGQLPNNLAGILPAPLAGALPNLPVPELPNLPLPPLPGLGAFDPATVANLQGFRNKLAVPDIDDVSSSQSVTPDISSSASEWVASATASLNPTSVEAVISSALPAPVYQAGGPVIAPVPSIVVSLESSASQAVSSASSSASAAAPVVAVTSLPPDATASLAPAAPVPSGAVNLQRRDGERLTPAGAQRKLQDNPNAQGLPDPYDASSEAQVPAVDAPVAVAGPSESIVADVQSIISSAASGLSPVPTSTVDGSGNPMTYLAPPLTADPTQDPANINFNTDSATYGPTATGAANSAPAPVGSGSSAASAPTAPAKKYRRDAGLPEAVSPQAPLPDDSVAADQVVDQTSSSHLKPLAPAIAPHINEYVVDYIPPSPAQSFHSAFSTPALSPSPTSSDWSLPSDGAALPIFDAGKDAVKLVSADPAGNTAIPSPYPGWSQDTVYRKADSSAGNGMPMAPIQPSPASNLVKPAGLGRFAKLRRQQSQPSSLEQVEEDHEEEAFGDVFSASNAQNKIDPHAEADAAGAPPSHPSNGVPGPPSNWSQDTVYKHSSNGGAAKQPALGGSVAQLIAKRGIMEATDGALVKRGGRPPLVRARAYSPQVIDLAPAPAEKRMRMVRFARYTKVRRDGDDLVEAIHQPPAGEHGQPPAVSKAADVEASASSESASSDTAQPTASAKGNRSHVKSTKKKGNKKPSSGEKPDTQHKKGKGKKKEPAPSAAPEEPAPTEEPAPAADAPEEAQAADEPAARLRKRSLLKRFGLRRWI